MTRKRIPPDVEESVLVLDKSIGRDEYRLDLQFQGDKLIATERYVVGYFGMNASFEGEYRRID